MNYLRINCSIERVLPAVCPDSEWCVWLNHVAAGPVMMSLLL